MGQGGWHLVSVVDVSWKYRLKKVVGPFVGYRILLLVVRND